MPYAFTVTLDCNTLEALATFWMAALHYRLVSQGPQVWCLDPPAGVAGVQRALQAVAERKQGKHRMHLDMPSTDREADRARRLRLGAVELQRHTQAGYQWVVLAAPEGNECCLAHVGAEPLA